VFRVETISVSISCPYETVYGFLADPANLFTWANVLGTKARPLAPLEWLAEEPAFTDKPITIRFTPRNAYGVLDITASADGLPLFWSPVRAFRNGEGTELTLCMLQRSDQSEESFRSELEWTRADLLTVKTLLESS
jgi:hypothetical protein